MEKELVDTKTELTNTNLQLEEVQNKITKLQSRDKYKLHDPTYSEVLNFIRSDRTDKHQYIENEYVCTHFARDVNNNAENHGIRCAFVSINLSGGEGHAIIAFNTTDKGLIFFDPQTDERLRYLRVGKDYWADCVIPRGNYYYERDPNNTVEDFTIVW